MAGIFWPTEAFSNSKTGLGEELCHGEYESFFRFHRTALDYETIFISGGRIGAQVEVSPQALLDLLGASAADITAE